MKFRLLGGPFEIMDTPFSGDSHLLKCCLGATFEMDEKLAKSAVRHGAAIVPPEVFDSCGFSAEDLAKYPNARLRQDAPPEFKAKYDAAMLAFRDYRAHLIAQEG